MPVLKTGPLTQAELFEVWKGALDKGYRNPLVNAGEGNGLEAHTQALYQLTRTSEAVDRTTQAMFICPWSGQTNPPAAGEAKATVTLTFQRTRLLDKPLILRTGQIFAAEQLLDMSTDGGIQVQTGRRYILTEDLIFHPGDMGPFTVPAEAELVGYGYNNPLPGNINFIPQPANNFENNLATVTVALGSIGLGTSNQAFIITPNEPDTFVPDHVGQYMLFTAGLNQFRVGHIAQFQGPNLSLPIPIGSTVLIEWTQSIQAAVYAGTFVQGERIDNVGPTARAYVEGERIVAGKKRLTFVVQAGTFVVGDVLTGQTSGATATIESLAFPQDYTPEAPVGPTGGATWRILDWVVDWGLTVTNVLSPSGGRHAWLDELGQERNLARAPGEDDETYRQRIKAIADVVTPNAIRRTLARTLGSIPYCFREVGTMFLPGFFYDGDNTPPHGIAGGALNDAWDIDTLILTGGPAIGTFIQVPVQEPVELEDATTGDNYATGYFGRILGGATYYDQTGPGPLIFIRKVGVVPSSFVNVRVRGTVSGATWAVTGAVVNLTAAERRFHVWLDYPQFRGFFMVCLPPLGLGEFGYAYDVGFADAFDLPSPYLTFYDGFPYLNSLVYGRVYQAIDQVRAGGVLFDLCLDDGSCP